MQARAVAFAVLVLAAPALAGCFTPAAEGPGGVVEPPATTAMSVGRTGVFHLNWTNPAAEATVAAIPRALGGQFHLGHDATEPSIGADKKGGVYMTAFGDVAGFNMPTIVATFDQGKTFQDVGPKGDNGVPHPITNDPIVHVDWDTGRVFMDDILPLSCGTISFSDDQGKTWTTNPYSCGNSQVNDHQTVGTAKARTLPTLLGYPNIVYRCVNNGAYSSCARSLNGGVTFLPQTVVYEPTYECAGLTAHLRSGPDGTIYLPKADCPSGPTVAWSDDDGTTWQKLVVKTEQKATDPADDHEMGFAEDSAGNLYALWEHDSRLWFSASTDQGKTWFPARDVTAPGVTATMFNALALGDDGKVAFAYLGSTIEGGYEGKGTGNPGLEGDIFGQPRLPEWDNATWNAYIGVIVDATNPDAPIQSVTANDPADPLARGLCGRTRCHGMNDFIEITIDAQGRPWAAFVDVCTEKCVTDPTVLSDQSQGMMATLVSGPALRGPSATLPVIPEQMH